jgi:hypothetical protein
MNVSLTAELYTSVLRPSRYLRIVSAITKRKNEDTKINYVYIHVSLTSAIFFPPYFSPIFFSILEFSGVLDVRAPALHAAGGHHCAL